MKELLRKNMTFTSSCLEHNNQGVDFKIKKHNIVPLKCLILADIGRTISRKIVKIEEYARKQRKTHVLNNDTYQEIDLYHEIAA